jgi:pyruvate dehydrogenase E2 component (dihydrolipoamide acetyltransferase)
MKEIELKVPNLGEAEDTEIIEISVKIGDKLLKNDPIIVLESEKAAMEVPSDFDGTIKDIKVKEGDSVKEGVVFAVMEVEETDETKPIEDTALSTSQELASTEVREPVSKVAPIDYIGINAGPAVRKIARELEIDLKKINGSGKNAMITKEDLKNYIHSIASNIPSYASLDSLKDFGEFEVEQQSKIRKLGAKNLTQSWTSIPHVTHFEEIDISIIEEQRSELNKKSETKLTPLSYLVMKVINALQEFPQFNAALIGEGKIMLRKYFNIGIAVDTKDGLLVPVIRDADSLNINEVANEILILAEKAKNKKLLEKNLSGGTFSISSLGPMGGIGFTPIINPPEVAILGVSRAKKVPFLEGDKLVEKTILPVALSYDHRVINGADAGRFMNFLKSEIEKGL